MKRRIALISDIHANAAAFKAVHDQINDEINGVWCLGDIVGRGPEPTLTARQAKRLYDVQRDEDKACWLAGNHDWLVLGKLSQNVFVDDRGEQIGTVSGLNGGAVQIASQHTSELRNATAVWDWLMSLPFACHPAPGLYLAHGVYIELDGTVSEWHGVNDYGYEVNLTRMFLNLFATRPPDDKPHVILLGHTHNPGVWRWNPDRQGIEPVTDWWRPQLYDNLAHSPIVVNPGSVGFPPRNGQAGRCPSYAVLDFEDIRKSVTVEFPKLTYDYTQNRIPSGYPQHYIDEMKRCNQSSSGQ